MQATSGAQKRAAKRAAKKAAYKNPKVANKEDSWCLKNGWSILLAVNITFALIGCALVGMGIYGSTGTFGEVFGTGPGFALVALGVVVILVAAGGQAGAYYDNKFVLLAYFFIVFAAFVAFCVLGGVATFGSGSINDKFSSFWCSHESDAVKVQNEFDCCGYECPFDRPAMGSCQFANGTVIRPLDVAGSGLTCAAADAAGASDDETAEAGKRICAAFAPIEGLKGCKVAGVDAAKERVAPLFILAFASGVALFIGTFISGYLLCRKTSKGTPSGADSSAVDANTAVPGANAPFAASATFEMTDTGDIGAGSAAESK